MTNRAKAIFWVIGVFLTGGLVGAGSMYLMHSPPSQAAPGDAPKAERQPGVDRPRSERRPRGRRGADASRSSFRRMADYLELSPEQREEMRGLVNEAMRRSQQLEEERAAKARRIRRGLMRRIRELLTPEQRIRMDEYRRRQRERFKERFREGGLQRPDGPRSGGPGRRQ